jgi:hypothetical protein
MKSLNKIVLFDIDHTLFNTVAFGDAVYEAHADVLTRDQFNQIIKGIKIGVTQKPKEISIEASIIKTLWDNADSVKNFYEETPEVLRLIGVNATIGIFSKGDNNFQRKKINSVINLFKEENIHVAKNKIEILSKVLSKYKNYQIYIVDDILEVLFQAKKINKEVLTVWIKRPAYYESYLINQAPIKDFTADFTVTNLREIIPIIEK